MLKTIIISIASFIFGCLFFYFVIFPAWILYQMAIDNPIAAGPTINYIYDEIKKCKETEECTYSENSIVNVMPAYDERYKTITEVKVKKELCQRYFPISQYYLDKGEFSINGQDINTNRRKMTDEEFLIFLKKSCYKDTNTLVLREFN